MSARSDACRRAIALLERGGSLGCELLSQIVADCNDLAFLRSRIHSGFAPANNRQRIVAILVLQAVIDGE
ncbi:MAG: hypothetical protein ACRDFS_02025 [Chloroflexota bacterium]